MIDLDAEIGAEPLRGGETTSDRDQGIGAPTAPNVGTAAFRGAGASDDRSDADDPTIGTIFEGRYRIEGRLAAGGMGTVYRGRQLSVNRPVVIKILNREWAGDREVVGRFIREAETVASLNHPHTVALYDFGETEDGLLYLVMECLEGRTLGAAIEAEAPFARQRLIDVCVAILAALIEAHDAGIVHRDLKPDNVFLANVGRDPEFVKILDFGIAKVRGGCGRGSTVTTEAKSALGSPSHVAPEQALGEEVSPVTDLYPIGIIAYEMLTGEHPLASKPSPMKMLVAQIQEAAAPPMVNGGRLEGPLVDWIMCCLAKNPSARFEDAEVAMRALEEARKAPLRETQRFSHPIEHLEVAGARERPDGGDASVAVAGASSEGAATGTRTSGTAGLVDAGRIPRDTQPGTSPGQERAASTHRSEPVSEGNRSRGESKEASGPQLGGALWRSAAMVALAVLLLGGTTWAGMLLSGGYVGSAAGPDGPEQGASVGSPGATKARDPGSGARGRQAAGAQPRRGAGAFTSWIAPYTESDESARDERTPNDAGLQSGNGSGGIHAGGEADVSGPGDATTSNREAGRTEQADELAMPPSRLRARGAKGRRKQGPSREQRGASKPKQHEGRAEGSSATSAGGTHVAGGGPPEASSGGGDDEGRHGRAPERTPRREASESRGAPERAERGRPRADDEEGASEGAPGGREGRERTADGSTLAESLPMPDESGASTRHEPSPSAEDAGQRDPDRSRRGSEEAPAKGRRGPEAGDDELREDSPTEEPSGERAKEERADEDEDPREGGDGIPLPEDVDEQTEATTSKD